MKRKINLYFCILSVLAVLLTALTVTGLLFNDHMRSIKSGLKNLLPDYMIPKVIEVLEKLPVNKNGKIDRKLLDEL